jgi:hypothetical protein
MDSESDKPLRLFVNPFALWTQLALKTGEAMWASAHAAAMRANARRVAVIPTEDAPPPKPRAFAPRRKAKATRAKLRSKVHSKRRVKR